MIEEITENGKSKKVMTQNIQEICDIIKRPSLRIIGIVEENPQPEDPENNFNRIIEENFPKLNKDILIKVQEAYRT